MERIAIWGTGRCFEDYYESIKDEYEVVALIDRNTAKEGHSLTSDNIVCILPSNVDTLDITFVAIALYDPEEAGKVAKQLDKMEIPHEHIAHLKNRIIYAKERAYLKSISYEDREEYRLKDGEKLVKFISYYLPLNYCNFGCTYCYVIRLNQAHAKWMRVQLPHSPEYTAYALRRERMGGSCYLAMAASGETLLMDGIVPLVREHLRNGHVVKVSTNGVITKTLEELLALPGHLLDNLIFTFSFHYLELKKRHMLDVYFDNVKKVRDSRASLYCMMIADDAYIPYIDEIKALYIEKLGVLPTIDFARDDKDLMNLKLYTGLKPDDYRQKWATFHAKKFALRMDTMDKQIQDCHAGNTFMLLDGGTGDVRYCSAMKEVIGNIFLNPKEFFSVDSYGKCNSSGCFVSSDLFTFGLMGDQPSSLRYGDMNQMIDDKGRHYIKPHLMSILNNRIG